MPSPDKAHYRRLLDLFCGGGGAAMGYCRAGWDVIGVDHVDQPHYPFKFCQADWRDGLAAFAPIVDAVHASPPCPGYSTMSNRWGSDSPRLIREVRAALAATGLPWVLENVMGAKSDMATTLVLHGGMFGLGVHRPRRFESNRLILAPTAPVVRVPIGVYGRRPDGRRLWGDQRAAASIDEAQTAMGMPWGDWQAVKDAIPPAYTEWIGGQLV